MTEPGQPRQPAPPAPPAPPTSPPPLPPPGHPHWVAPQRDDPLKDYHLITDTVGGPSLRAKDNLIQGAVVLWSAAVGAGVGYLVRGGMGAILGGVGMAVVSTLVSGLVLMVLGWVRAAKRR
ncbi:MAG: hypothetical protein WD749_06805 [Phycisphaerales bacterium]